MLLSRVWSQEDGYSALLDDSDEQDHDHEYYVEINYDIENQLI